MAELLAVRRGLTPGAVFFRQAGTRLEYSLDTVTWKLAYDFGPLACVTADQATAYTNLVTSWGLYNGNVSSVAADMVYNSSGADYARDRAMCAAVSSLWDMYDQLVRAAASGWPWSILTDAVNAAARIVLTSWPFLSYSTNTYWRIVEGAKAFGNSIAAQLQSGPPALDSDSLDALKCCVYDALKGATPTYAAFTAAFEADTCDFSGPGSPEAAAMDAMQAAALASPDMYLAFLTTAQALYALMPSDFACACDDRWTHVLNFTKSTLPPELTVNNISLYTHIPLVGLRATQRTQPSFSLNETFTMFGLGINTTFVVGTGATSPYFRSQWTGVNAPQYLNFETSATGTFKVDLWSPAPMTVNGSFTVDHRPASAAYNNGQAVLRTMTIYGQGVNPFD